MAVFRLAFRNLFRNKRRTTITLVSIAFSVALTSFMRFLTFGTHQENIDQMVGLTTGYIQVAGYGWIESRRRLERAVDYTEELQQKLKHPDILAISPRIEAGALVARKEHSAFVRVQGANPEKEKHVTSLYRRVKEGEYLESGFVAAKNKDGVLIHQAIIGQRLATNLEAEVGSVISIVGSRFDGSTGAALARVVGIVNTGNPELDGTYLWTDLETARILFAPDSQDQGLRRYTSIALATENPLIAEDVYDDLKDRFPTPVTELPPEHSRVYDPVVLFWDDLNQDLVQYLLLDQIGNEITLMFLILIMASGVMTTVEMSLHERQREFGILMAIGTRGAHLIKVVMLEVFLLLLFGILPGLIIGMAGGYYLQFNPIDISGDLGKAMQEMGSVVTVRAIVNFQETYIAILSLMIPSLALSYLAVRKIPRLHPVEVIGTL
ncbi:MAG: ABC transporter permease [Leptospiraceae bacterium]|nr:ABC transporter permease [Leptospiraceae bacterium]